MWIPKQKLEDVLKIGDYDIFVLTRVYETNEYSFGQHKQSHYIEQMTKVVRCSKPAKLDWFILAKNLPLQLRIDKVSKEEPPAEYARGRHEALLREVGGYTGERITGLMQKRVDDGCLGWELERWDSP